MRKLCGLPVSWILVTHVPRARIGIVEREAPLERPSAKHARLVEIYGTRNPDLSPGTGAAAIDAGALSRDAVEGGIEAGVVESKPQQASLRRPER